MADDMEEAEELLLLQCGVMPSQATLWEGRDELFYY